MSGIGIERAIQSRLSLSAKDPKRTSVLLKSRNEI